MSIPKGLSVGSIFEDGGLHYRVQAITPDGNYSSKLVEDEISKEEAQTIKSSTIEEKCEEKAVKEAESIPRQTKRRSKAK